MLVYSCKKDLESDTKVNNQTATASNFSQLKIGNYWIYQHFDIDENGNSTPTTAYDSCYVEKDTIVNNRTYYKVIKPHLFFPNQKEIIFQRDSLDYIVNLNGKILFSSQDFSTIFESSYEIAGQVDTIYQIIRKMEDKDMDVVVPLGTFKTSNAKETFLVFQNWATFGSIRYKNNRYAENIGIVVETYLLFINRASHKERRLLRYHVN